MSPALAVLSNIGITSVWFALGWITFAGWHQAMQSFKRIPSHFAVGVILGLLGGFGALLYSRLGFWGVGTLVLIFQLWGIKTLCDGFNRASQKGLLKAQSWTLWSIAANVVALIIWSVWLRDLDGLPQSGDGVVHTLFMTQSWAQKAFPLYIFPTRFSDVFGAQAYQFYPSAAHAILVWIGWPLRLSTGFLTEALIAKASIVAIHLLFVSLAQNFAYRSFLGWDSRSPLRKWAGPLSLVVAAFTLTHYRLPMVVHFEGGLTRLLSIGLACLWGLPKLLDRPDTARNQPRRDWVVFLLEIVGFAILYAIHPSGFIAGLLLWVWIYFGTKAAPKLRGAVMIWFSIHLVALLGAAGLAHFALSPARFQDSQIQTGLVLPSSRALLQSLSEGIGTLGPWLRFKELLLSGWLGESFSHLLIRKLLFWLTPLSVLFAMVWSILNKKPKALGTAPWERRVWVGCCVYLAFDSVFVASGAVAKTVLASLHAPNRIGLAFSFFGAPLYHLTNRAAELHWPVLPVFWTAGLGLLAMLLNNLQSLIQKRHAWAQWTKLLVALFLVSEAFYKWPRSLFELDGAHAFFSSHYRAPRYSTGANMILEVERIADGLSKLESRSSNLEQPIVLAAPPFFADTFGWRTHASVEPLFIYGECPVGGSDPLQASTCKERYLAWTQGRLSALWKTHRPHQRLLFYTPDNQDYGQCLDFPRISKVWCLTEPKAVWGNQALDPTQRVYRELLRHAPKGS